MPKPLTNEDIREALDKAYAYTRGYDDGEKLDMSNPNEPRFEDDFFNEPSDDDPQEIEMMSKDEITLYSIAITKAHAYAQEYNRHTGRVEDKPNYHALKEGYVAGFLEGFAHRLTHTTGE